MASDGEDAIMSMTFVENIRHSAWQKREKPLIPESVATNGSGPDPAPVGAEVLSVLDIKDNIIRSLQERLDRARSLETDLAKMQAHMQRDQEIKRELERQIQDAIDGQNSNDTDVYRRVTELQEEIVNYEGLLREVNERCEFHKRTYLDNQRARIMLEEAVTQLRARFSKCWHFFNTVSACRDKPTLMRFAMRAWNKECVRKRELRRSRTSEMVLVRKFTRRLLLSQVWQLFVRATSISRMMELKSRTKRELMKRYENVGSAKGNPARIQHLRVIFASWQSLTNQQKRLSKGVTLSMSVFGSSDRRRLLNVSFFVWCTYAQMRPYVEKMESQVSYLQGVLQSTPGASSGRTTREEMPSKPIEQSATSASSPQIECQWQPTTPMLAPPPFSVEPSNATPTSPGAQSFASLNDGRNAKSHEQYVPAAYERDADSHERYVADIFGEDAADALSEDVAVVYRPDAEAYRGDCDAAHMRGERVADMGSDDDSGASSRYEVGMSTGEEGYVTAGDAATYGADESLSDKAPRGGDLRDGLSSGDDIAGAYKRDIDAYIREPEAYEDAAACEEDMVDAYKRGVDAYIRDTDAYAPSHKSADSVLYVLPDGTLTDEWDARCFESACDGEVDSSTPEYRAQDPSDTRWGTGGQDDEGLWPSYRVVGPNDIKPWCADGAGTSTRNSAGQFSRPRSPEPHYVQLKREVFSARNYEEHQGEGGFDVDGENAAELDAYSRLNSMLAGQYRETGALSGAERDEVVAQLKAASALLKGPRGATSLPVSSYVGKTMDLQDLERTATATHLSCPLRPFTPPPSPASPWLSSRAGAREKNPLAAKRKRSPFAAKREESPFAHIRLRSPAAVGREQNPVVQMRVSSPLLAKRETSPFVAKRETNAVHAKRDISPVLPRRDTCPLPAKRETSPVAARPIYSSPVTAKPTNGSAVLAKRVCSPCAPKRVNSSPLCFSAAPRAQSPQVAIQRDGYVPTIAGRAPYHPVSRLQSCVSPVTIVTRTPLQSPAVSSAQAPGIRVNPPGVTRVHSSPLVMRGQPDGTVSLQSPVDLKQEGAKRAMSTGRQRMGQEIIDAAVRDFHDFVNGQIFYRDEQGRYSVNGKFVQLVVTARGLEVTDGNRCIPATKFEACVIRSSSAGRQNVRRAMVTSPANGLGFIKLPNVRGLRRNCSHSPIRTRPLTPVNAIPHPSSFRFNARPAETAQTARASRGVSEEDIAIDTDHAMSPIPQELSLRCSARPRSLSKHRSQLGTERLPQERQQDHQQQVPIRQQQVQQQVQTVFQPQQSPNPQQQRGRTGVTLVRQASHVKRLQSPARSGSSLFVQQNGGWIASTQAVPQQVPAAATKAALPQTVLITSSRPQ